MKPINLCFSAILVAIFLATAGAAAAQGTAFTYQGRLNDSTGPTTGTYDFQFAIYDSSNAIGAPISGPLTNSAVAVSGGQFATPLDFGDNVFTGAPRWLEIGVRTNGAGAFATLAPRQALTPVPYAIYAPNAAVAATARSIAATNIGGLLLASQLPAFTNFNDYGNLTVTGTGTITTLSNLGPTVVVGVGEISFPNTNSVIIGPSDRAFHRSTLVNTNAASEDTLIGHNAGLRLLGTYNSFYTLIGSAAGGNLTNGAGGVAIGQKSLVTATNSGHTVAVGGKSLANVPNAEGDTAVGYAAAQWVTQIGTGHRTFIGENAGQYSWGDNNVFVGSSAGNQTTEDRSVNNVAAGAYALGTETNLLNSVGIGYQALFHDIDGGSSVAIGYQVAMNLPYANCVTAIGNQSLHSGWINGATGVIALGAGAGNRTAQANNVMMIGGDGSQQRISDIYINEGNAPDAASQPVTIHGSGAGNADSAGGGVTLAGGLGAGTGSGGDLNLAVSLPSDSSPSQNPLTTVLSISGATGVISIGGDTNSPPLNPTMPVGWLVISNQGNSYRLPLYQ